MKNNKMKNSIETLQRRIDHMQSSVDYVNNEIKHAEELVENAKDKLKKFTKDLIECEEEMKVLKNE